jgi:hypothetical protein
MLVTLINLQRLIPKSPNEKTYTYRFLLRF